MRFSVRHLLLLTLVFAVLVPLVWNYQQPTPIRIELKNETKLELKNLILKFGGHEIEDIPIASIGAGETQVFQMEIQNHTSVAVLNPRRNNGSYYIRPIEPLKIRFQVMEKKYELSINKNNIKNLK